MENIIEIIKTRVEILQNPYLQIKIYSPFVFLFLRIYFITVKSKLTFSFCRAGGNIHGRNLANNTGGENRQCVLGTLVYEAGKSSLFIISSACLSHASCSSPGGWLCNPHAPYDLKYERQSKSSRKPGIAL